MKIGIYDKYLNTMGGGEKHACAFAERATLYGEVELLVHEEVDKDLLASRLNLNLERVSIRYIPNLPESELEAYTKEYDVFINATAASKLKSLARYSMILLFFPPIKKNKYPKFLKKLFLHIFRPVFNIVGIENEYKGLAKIRKKYIEQTQFFSSDSFIKSYDKVLVNSKYTKDWTMRLMNVESEILYPPIDIDKFTPMPKSDIILSVGRFFVYSHNKKQLEMIKFFKQMYDLEPALKTFEYHLVGGRHKGKEHEEYINKCIDEAKGYPIFFHFDAEFNEVQELFGKAKVFWHASGYGENIEKDPDLFEHFGMTTVESMSAGAIPVVIGMAGQKEIVQDDFNGFTWLTPEELINKTIQIIKDNTLAQRLSKNAKTTSEKYSREAFNTNVDKIMKEIQNNP